MKRLLNCLLGCLPWMLCPVGATTFFCDPEKGSIENTGTEKDPWGTLEEVIANGLIEQRDADGGVTKEGAVVKGGDTILLRTGYHGRIHVRGGYNSGFITIAAEDGHKAGVSQVVIDGGSMWRVKGLHVSPSLATKWPVKPIKHVVSLGEHGRDDCNRLEVLDCFIFTVPDASSWSAEDWVKKASSGIWLGRHGRAHTARNNYILNTRMGIDICAPDSLCEGNVIDGFSGDGIRVTRDGIQVRHNVIRNNFVSEGDGDGNHDDGIQSFLFNKGRGLVRDVMIDSNVIMQRSQRGLPFPNPLQGIGFFDGPLVNYEVTDNVVMVNHYHGVSVYDGQGCDLSGNACWNPDTGSKFKPWVMLGQKQGLAEGNRVVGNLAHSFNFKADRSLKAKDNRQVDAQSFRKRWEQVTGEIVRRFGERHQVSGRVRVTGGIEGWKVKE